MLGEAMRGELGISATWLFGAFTNLPRDAALWALVLAAVLAQVAYRLATRPRPDR